MGDEFCSGLRYTYTRKGALEPLVILINLGNHWCRPSLQVLSTARVVQSVNHSKEALRQNAKNLLIQVENKGEIFRHQTSRDSSKGEDQLSQAQNALQHKAGAPRKT